MSGLAPALILPVGRAVVLRGADTTAVPLAQPGHSITGAAAPATTTASNPYRPAAGPADLSSTRAVRRSEGTAHSLISTGTRTAQQGPVLPAPLPLSTSAASEQWRAAVARQPLEQPQPFTGGLARLARTVAGRSVRWTTGPATRAALAVSGATAATTGTVVHLPAPPHRTDPTVLVHELSHLRSTVGRPRFLRPAATVSADSEERRAVAATQAMVSPAPMLARVPTTAMRTASSTASSTVPSSAPSIASLPAAAASVSPPAALSTATLPVAGLAGIPRAVHDQVQRLATTAVGGSSGGGTGGATGALQRAVDVGGIAAQPGVSGVGPGATAAPTGGPDATGAPGDSGGSIDLDAMVELLEARLVREFERRGGRFAEVF